MARMVEQKELVQRLIGSTANTILYQPPSTVTYTRIKTIFVCNLTAGALSYNIYVNQNGTSASDQNALFKVFAIASRITDRYIFEADSGIILQNGGSIVVVASAINSITMTLYGEEVTET